MRVTQNKASGNELYHKGNDKKLHHSVLQIVSVNQNNKCGMNGILFLLTELLISNGSKTTTTFFHTEEQLYSFICTYIFISKYIESKGGGGETEICNDEHLADCHSVILCDTAHEVMLNM
jgi:hypothetical protein